MKALAIASSNKNIYALREDGAVFVLISRGSIRPDNLQFAEDPYWAVCPAVPGTEAAVEQVG